MPTKRYRWLLSLSVTVLAVVAMTSGAARNVSATAAAGGDPASLVNPFTGTAGSGNTYPGATVPFGMVQPSPDTPSDPPGGGYSYNDSAIDGFSSVHLSGPGCPALGHVSLMPVTGPVTGTNDSDYASPFSHSAEEASPGYYAVSLTRYGIKAELTATARTAWERFSFPASGAGTVLLNLGAAQKPTTAANLTVTGPDTVTGSQSTQLFCNPGYRPVTVYFAARFSEPFTATGTWDNGPVTWGSTTANGTAIGAALRFAGRSVTASVGVSYVSAANAAANLRAETPRSGGFDTVRQQAHATWEKWLGRARVSGGTTAQEQTYYTSLYHALIEPNTFSDVNGQYFGMDGKVRTAKGRTEYTNLSLWDTYRTQQELLDLIAPTVARDVVLSLVSDTEELGWVPRWVLANEETNTMSGDSVTEFFADALAARVVTPAEVRPVYSYLTANATSSPPPGSEAEGRDGIAFYRAHGYVPFTTTGAYDQRSAASATLEYALADCGLSHVASALGQSADAADFTSTAQDYRSEFDSSTGFFRPRLADGSYLTPFDPAFVSLPYITADAAGFDEGSAWQYRWLVPQDPAGLAGLLGGPAPAIGDLNTFFDYDQVAADPSSAPADWSGGGRYDPTNEGDLQAPYTYDALGVPWRTQAMVRAALGIAQATPGGVPGNEDLGEMGAWYVMSALGLYPYAAGQGSFVLSAPLFPSATVAVSGRRPLVITSPGAGTYIDGLTVDGHPSGDSWLSFGQVAAGGTLAYRTGSVPDQAWAAGAAAAEPAYCAA